MSTPRPINGSKFETFQWYWFRFSGLLLVGLAFFHLWLNHIHTEVGELNYNLVITRLTEWPILRVVDFLLLALGLSHGLLGIKNIIDDRAKTRGQRLFWLNVLAFLFMLFLIAGTAVLWTLEGNA